jgi:hypothetical protein
MLLLAALPPWPHHVDRGVLILVAALFLATILAHRYWRATIRLEDEAAAKGRDLERSLDRYRLAFRVASQPMAFVDRVTGLVLEAGSGWAARGLPETGEVLFAGDAALEAAWRAIPGPDSEHAPAPARDLTLAGQAFRAEPLGGFSLGIVLVHLA